MPTTNPVPSQDPSDLLFNAGKLDEVLNGTSNSFTDRLGVARRTVAGMNADFDAQLADAESDLNVYRADAAASAAEALGYLQTIRATSYGAYASDPATDPLGNPPTVGDEYFNTTANLLKRWNGTTWQASDINTANLAAPSGSSLVGFQPAGTGAVATTVQEVLLETVSVKRFGAKCDWDGTTGTDDFLAIQKALDYANDKPGFVELIVPARAFVSGKLVMGSYTGLTGAAIISSATNLPVVEVSKNTLNRNWKVRDITLAYVNQQAANAGGNALALTGNGTASYMFEVDNVVGSKCSSAVAFSQTDGASIFMGKIDNIFSYDGSSYAIKIDAPNIGAHTSIEIGTAYYQGVQGAERSTTGVLKADSINGLFVKNIACDRSSNQNGLVNVTNCRGRIENIVCELNIITASIGNGGLVMASNSQMDINYVCSTANVINISGSASYSGVRGDSGSNLRVAQFLDNNCTINDTSSDNYYTFATDITSILENDRAQAVGSSPAISVNEFGTNTVFRTRRVNGNQKTRIEGGKIVTFGTAAPTSGTWAVGDRLINTAPSLTGTTATGWECVAAGTPGTWVAISTLVAKGPTTSRPSNPSLGTLFLDTTLAAKGKPIWNNETPVKAVVTFVVTGPAVSSGNFIITLDGGSPLYIPVTAGNTAGTIAAYVRGLYVAGYTIGGSGTTVTFTKDIAKAVASPTFSENGTGVTASITLTTQGISGWVDSTGTEV